jgi:hypothetical protein
MAGVGELDSSGPSYVIADTDATLAKDAVVIITNPERAVLSDRQLLGNISRKLVEPDVVDGSLQLSVAALGTAIVRGAMLFMFGVTSCGIPGEDELQALMTQLLESQFVGMDNHPFRYRCDTSQLGLSGPFHLNDTEAAGPIGLQLSQGFQARVVTQRRDIDSSLLGRLKYSRPLLHLDLSRVDGKSDLFHFAPH